MILHLQHTAAGLALWGEAFGRRVPAEELRPAVGFLFAGWRAPMLEGRGVLHALQGIARGLTSPSLVYGPTVRTAAEVLPLVLRLVAAGRVAPTLEGNEARWRLTLLPEGRDPALLNALVDLWMRTCASTPLSRAQALKAKFHTADDAWLAVLRAPNATVSPTSPDLASALRTWASPLFEGGRAALPLIPRHAPDGWRLEVGGIEGWRDGGADGSVEAWKRGGVGEGIACGDAGVPGAMPPAGGRGNAPRASSTPPRLHASTPPPHTSDRSLHGHREATTPPRLHASTLLLLGQAIRVAPMLALPQPWDGATFARFLGEAVPALRAAAFAVDLPPALEPSVPEVRETALGLTGDAVRVARTIAFAGVELSEEEAQAVLDAGEPLAFVHGAWRYVDLEALRRALEALGPATLPRGRALPLLLAGALRVGPEAQDVRDFLREMSTPPEGELPLRETLRPYQAQGVCWLMRAATHGLGVCLADDMGLGKTLQTIAFLLSRPGPALVVAPLTVLPVWERELARWAPGLRVLRHDGPQRVLDAGFARLAQSADVTLTAYGYLWRDYTSLRRVPWSTLVLDEAQLIKNPATRQSQAARSLGADFRLALTGTPIENRLDDLWSLLDFLNPGLFGPRRDFATTYADPAKLRRAVSHFLLRRLKSDPDILAELPPKIVQVHYAPLTETQTAAYDLALADYARASHSLAASERAGAVLVLLTRLKQICDGLIGGVEGWRDGGTSLTAKTQMLGARGYAAPTPAPLEGWRAGGADGSVEAWKRGGVGEGIACGDAGVPGAVPPAGVRGNAPLASSMPPRLHASTPPPHASDRSLHGPREATTPPRLHASTPLPHTSDRSLHGPCEATTPPRLHASTPPSGKLLVLLPLLEEILANGESALVFTQFVAMGEWVRRVTEERLGRSVPFVHGGLSAKQRRAELEAFSNDARPGVLILSLRTGAFGLTLTKANHVIHLDRWWNPAVEAQATDRAHRIGQRRTVVVHHLLCRGTLEDRIDRLLRDKRDLADRIVAPTPAALLARLPTDTLMGLLRRTPSAT